MKRFIGFLTVILLIVGCKQETETGVIGQQFLLKADVPNEVGTFDYIWKIMDLPETSELTLTDMQFSEDESQAIFVPDVAGHYNVQVTVWKYNDKLGAIAYNYDIVEPSAESVAEQTANDAWLNESVDSVTQDEVTIEETEYSTDEYTEEQIDEVKSSGTEATDNQPIKIDDANIAKEVADETHSTIEEVKEVVETPVVEDVVTTPPVQANYTIQIAADSKKKSAQQVVDRFTNAGFDAYIQETITASNQKMYRIRIGKFTTREDAIPTANRIQSEHGMDTWITNYQK